MSSERLLLRALPALATALIGLAAVPGQAAVMFHADPAGFAAAVSPQGFDDFEAAPWAADTNYAGPVASQGITWSAANTLRASTFMPHSGRVALSDVDGSPDLLDTLTAQLADEADGFGLWLRSTLLRANVEFALLDANGMVLDSFTQTFFDQWTFLGFSSDTPFASVRLHATGSGGGFVDDFLVDDVAYGTARPAQVPEPGSLALLGLGLAALTRARKQH